MNEVTEYILLIVICLNKQKLFFESNITTECEKLQKVSDCSTICRYNILNVTTRVLRMHGIERSLPSVIRASELRGRFEG